jgi:hypothetical protein
MIRAGNGTNNEHVTEYLTVPGAAMLPFRMISPIRGDRTGIRVHVRVCCDTPQEASVVDALASFGVVHADMPLTLANIWLAIQGPACSEGPARQCFP